LTAVVVKSGYMLETPVRLIVHPENQDRDNLSDRDNQQERLDFSRILRDYTPDSREIWK